MYLGDGVYLQWAWLWLWERLDESLIDAEQNDLCGAFQPQPHQKPIGCRHSQDFPFLLFFWVTSLFFGSGAPNAPLLELLPCASGTPVGALHILRPRLQVKHSSLLYLPSLLFCLVFFVLFSFLLFPQSSRVLSFSFYSLSIFSFISLLLIVFLFYDYMPCVTLSAFPRRSSPTAVDLTHCSLDVLYISASLTLNLLKSTT